MEGGEKEQSINTSSSHSRDLRSRDVSPEKVTASSLLQAAAVEGSCRVICFHPKLNVTLPLMSLAEIANVIDTWIQEAVRLSAKFTWVQIFENKGEVMGCSNPHPHCQVWASSFLPNEARAEDLAQREYWQQNKTLLLADYVQQELRCQVETPAQSRIVCENDDWLAVVPFWAIWPYETLLLPKHNVQRLQDVSAQQKETLASIMKRLTTKYDNLFETSFPYSMGWHGTLRWKHPYFESFLLS